MHLAGLISSLFIHFWRGTLETAGALDDPDSWDWNCLGSAEVFKAHGLDIVAAGRHLPKGHDRKPSNLEEDITSGYKTWQWNLLFFGLDPGLLYEVLPLKYWKINYCRLVRGFRIVCQHSITEAELREAKHCFDTFYQEFEDLYYQRREDRLCFIRQSIHQLLHLASEVVQKGPPIIYAQWTMERTIGNLGQEIRQPSKLYANLSREGVRRCQVNILKALIPSLDPEPAPSSMPSVDVGEGYALLHKRSRREYKPSGVQKDALSDWLGRECPEFWMWGRARLSDGQVVRSAWRENTYIQENIRISRHVKIAEEGRTFIGEVLYFAQLDVKDEQTGEWRWEGVAVVELYSEPDSDLLTLSSRTFATCKRLGPQYTHVVNIKQIAGVVGMVPHRPTLLSGIEEDRFYMVEKPGLDVATFVGNDEEDERDE
ncbi:hypothetical protein CONPUDRAFT_41273, partial [Coniophora puteana RWD-64-598 SS2]